MDRHGGVERRDPLREPLAGLAAQPLGPAAEDRAGGRVQTLDRAVVQLARQRERGQPRRVQDLVGVGVADAREEPRIGQAALQRVVLARERGAERRQVGPEHVEAAAIVRLQVRTSGDQMQPGALDGAGLGHQQGAAREVESRQPQLLRHGRARRAPAQAPGDHQVQDDEQVALDADDDALAEACDGLDGAPLDGPERRRDGPQHEGAQQPDPLDLPPDDARREARHVDLDVGQFRHLRSV